MKLVELTKIISSIPVESCQKAPEESLNQILDIDTSISGHSTSQQPIDVDSLPDNPPPTCNLEKSTAQELIYKKALQLGPCHGIIIATPPGKSIHTLYPFALHESLSDTWDYSVNAGNFVLRSRGCTLQLDDACQTNQSRCKSCATLSKNPNVVRIVDRIQDGVHSSAPFHYHGVGGLITILRKKTGTVRALRLRRLNDAKKLVIKVRALDMHKQFIMAIGSTKVECIE